MLLDRKKAEARSQRNESKLEKWNSAKELAEEVLPPAQGDEGHRDGDVLKLERSVVSFEINYTWN